MSTACAPSANPVALPAAELRGAAQARDSWLDYRANDDWETTLTAMALTPGAADICINSRGRVRLKVRGDYCSPKINDSLLTSEGWWQVCRLLHPASPAMADGEFVREGGREVGAHRYRVSRVRELFGEEFTLRILPTKIPTPSSILLPDELVKRFCDLHEGLVVFAGSTGHGKSTSIASLIGENARRTPLRIVTIEDPVEYLHVDQPNGSTFTYREVGAHTKTFASAMRDAMRMRPDIIAVGEIRDAQSAEVACEAALTGHKVVSTIHGGDVTQAMQRLCDLTSDNGNSGVGALAQAFRICVAQRLLASGTGQRSSLVPIHEIMTLNESVASKIRGDKLFSLRQEMEAGRSLGMQTFAQSHRMRTLSGLLQS